MESIRAAPNLILGVVGVKEALCSVKPIADAHRIPCQPSEGRMFQAQRPKGEKDDGCVQDSSISR